MIIMCSHCVGLYQARHQKQHSWIFSLGSFHEHKHLTEWRQHEIPFKPIEASRAHQFELGRNTVSWACRKWETSADKPSQLIYKCRSKRDRPIKLAPDKVMIAGKTSWTGDGKTCSWTTLGKIETVIYWKRGAYGVPTHEWLGLCMWGDFTSKDVSMCVCQTWYVLSIECMGSLRMSMTVFVVMCTCSRGMQLIVEGG